MSKLISFFIISIFACNAYADGFDIAMANVVDNCSNISGDLNDLKKMAGINTAITGVGTATAVGATVVGIVKSSVDEEIENILEEALKGKEKPIDELSENDINSAIDAYFKTSKENTNGTDRPNSKDDFTAMSEESKTLGNWRTGLIGTSTATNVAGAVIAGNNKSDEDLQTKIDECIKSVENLKNAIGQARADGLDVTQANQIVTECGEWKNVDLSTINDRAKGAMISSIIGAVTGAAGTVTSAMANSDSVRNGNDNEKEKNLNTAANVLSGGTAVASGVATVFNATQISAVKKIVAVAEKCEETLK